MAALTFDAATIEPATNEDDSQFEQQKPSWLLPPLPNNVVAAPFSEPSVARVEPFARFPVQPQPEAPIVQPAIPQIKPVVVFDDNGDLEDIAVPENKETAEFIENFVMNPTVKVKKLRRPKSAPTGELRGRGRPAKLNGTREAKLAAKAEMEAAELEWRELVKQIGELRAKADVARERFRKAKLIAKNPVYFAEWLAELAKKAELEERP